MGTASGQADSWGSCRPSRGYLEPPGPVQLSWSLQTMRGTLLLIPDFPPSTDLVRETILRLLRISHMREWDRTPSITQYAFYHPYCQIVTRQELPRAELDRIWVIWYRSSMGAEEVLCPQSHFSGRGKWPLHSIEAAVARLDPCLSQWECPRVVGSAPGPRQTPHRDCPTASRDLPGKSK